MKLWLTGCSRGTLILLLTASAAWAQATAQMSGTVRDSSGAVLPGVTVTVTQTDTSSRADGRDRCGRGVPVAEPPDRSLPAGGDASGVPHLRADRHRPAGWRDAVDQRWCWRSAQRRRNDLGRGRRTARRTSAARGSATSSRTSSILQLPLQRPVNAAELVLTVGAAVQTGTPARGVPGGRADLGGRWPAVRRDLHAGWRDAQQPAEQYQLSAAISRCAAGIPRVDHERALGRERHALQAPHVSAVTKSGTNRFAGTVFEFLRDHRFNSTSPFAAIGSDGKRAGRWPEAQSIRRNTRWANRARQAVLLRRVSGHDQASACRRTTFSSSRRRRWLAGDFTAFASPACNGGRQLNLGAPFAGNRIDPARLQSSGACTSSKRLPTTTDPVRPDHLCEHAESG